MKKISVVSLVLPLLALASVARAQLTRAGSPAEGKVVYERYCISCHGELGNGGGEFAEWITTKPRDYRQGTFKWRSTPSGSLPLDSDLEKTIRDGIYGTFMPSWYAIGEQSRRDVIAYIKTFSAKWTTEQPQPAITIPPEPPYNDASVTARPRGLRKVELLPVPRPERSRRRPLRARAQGRLGQSDRPVRPDGGAHQVR